MNLSIKQFIQIVFTALLSSTAFAGWFGPKDYDECIIENVKSASTNTAVAAIKKSCRAKFPDACVEWTKKFEEWRIKSRLYYNNKPSCDADKSFKIKTCNKGDQNCISPSLQEEIRRTLCEINFSLNAPIPPGLPEGCE